MKKIIIMSAALAVLAGVSISAQGVKAKKTLHYFESAVCPSCKKASEYMNSAAGKIKLKDVSIVKYELLNKDGKMDANNKKNMRTLIMLLDAVKSRKGAAPFIYKDRVEYQYYSKNGVPYYKKEDRYSRKDEPLPVPLFLINDKLFIGFNQYVMDEIDKAAK